MDDKLVEEYKRQLADVETAYSLVEKTIRYCGHFTINKSLCEALHLLSMAKRDLQEVLK
jgi:hypothetical protein